MEILVLQYLKKNICLDLFKKIYVYVKNLTLHNAERWLNEKKICKNLMF